MQTSTYSNIMASLTASLIPIFLFAWLGFNSEAAPAYSSHFCDNSTSLTPNSSYQANINTLFSSLSSNAGIRKNGFFNTTAGEAPNLVYGTLLCRGDVSANLCRDCVTTATKDIGQRCLTEKMGVIWYDECTVRYSDQNIFSIIREVPGMDRGSSVTIPDKDLFNQLLSRVMNNLANRAAYDDRSGKKFATGVANFSSSFQTLYSLVQCTPDLTEALCFRCLQSAIATIPMCCDGKQGGRVLLPSCNIRYEMFPFYSLNGTGATLFPSPSSRKGRRKMSTPIIIAIVAPVGITSVLLVLGLLLLRRRRARKKYNALPEENVVSEEITPNSESLLFNLGTIEAATNNFSSDNKIGEGGFGEVYKGKLSNGQEVAVKRLSKSSVHGTEQFKNEVALLAKLQHRNLVRLLGFCLGGKEKLLVYEYVANKSLDYFLFDSKTQGDLDWSMRYKIIGGIARGLLYLHADSRLRIIHRDLKPSNILLDEDMNAKISDFGMAKIFDLDQTKANTKRIVGTYGYMSPEYAMHGQFSMKSDVFSFGVLILEIMSGKRNCSFSQSDGANNLLSYCWKLWREGTPLELMDSNLGGNYSRDEAVRCIHVALLCVQNDPAKRPTITNVVLMLDSNSVSMSVPREPGFFHVSSQAKGMELSDESSSKSTPLSANEVSITEFVPR